MNIASLGTSTAATAGTNAAKGATKLAQLTEKFNKMKKTFLESKGVAKIVAKAKEIGEKTKDIRDKVGKVKEQYDNACTVVETFEEVDQLKGEITEADIIRLSAQIAGLADPSGIAGVVAAYSHPLCSAVFH